MDYYGDEHAHVSPTEIEKLRDMISAREQALFRPKNRSSVTSLSHYAKNQEIR